MIAAELSLSLGATALLLGSFAVGWVTGAANARYNSPQARRRR